MPPLAPDQSEALVLGLVRQTILILPLAIILPHCYSERAELSQYFRASHVESRMIEIASYLGSLDGTF